MRDALPLTSRAGALSGLRALLLAAVLTAAWLGPQAAIRPSNAVVLVSGAYALVAVALAAPRLLTGAISRSVLGCGLLIDGVYLVAVVTLTGGPDGPLGLLVLVHLVAVTLLASYRTGLKLVVWNSLLLAVAYAAQRSGTIGGAAPSRQAAVTAATAFLLVALVTAACSALNERELRRGRAGYGALAAMAADMQRVEHAGDIGLRLLEAVDRYTGYRRSLVLLPGPEGGVFACSTTGGARRTLAFEGSEVTGVLRRCWDRRGAVLTRDLDPSADRPIVQALPGARNLVVLPLVADGTPLGALVVERAGGRWARVPSSVVALLVQFAAHAMLAYQNLDLRDRLERLAALDGLTQLPNRRMFDEALAREWQRSRRTEESLAILLLDLDRFKVVNDRHGHLVGDEVLRQVAGVVAGTVRASDLPARYGGEEFAVLLPGCDTAGAAGVAEKVRAAVADITSPVRVTVSIGVASTPQGARDEEDLVAAADAALYRAKAAGRNRVERAAGPTHDVGDTQGRAGNRHASARSTSPAPRLPAA